MRLKILVTSRRFLKKFFLLFASLGMFGGGVLLLWASSLSVPDLKTFNERKVVQSTKIYDHTGEILLYDIHNDVQRTVVSFEGISRHMKNATVAIEDAEFYEHRGIKPSAIFRAILVNIGSFGYEQGGSTITQQVVKNSLLTPEKKITRKLKEWILAIKLEKTVSKEEILTLYLNEAPYGGNVYGVEEASKAFFDKNASELSLAESAYLAALPQAPTFYSPYGNNLDALEERKNMVLSRMRDLGFVAKEDVGIAQREIVTFQPQATFGIRAPHFVFFVREQLEKKFGKELIENGGLKITTSLNYGLQEKAEEIVARFAEENVEKYNANNAGLVALDPKTGHVLAMVGSKNYFDSENEGNFNITLAHRQPGSAFKPFVYATAFAKGYTPDTVVFDLETQFDTGCDPQGKPLYESVREDDCYMPSNYDSIFRGPVTLRNALAQSINIPAIKVLYLSGIKNAIETASVMGITSLSNPNRYGLTLVLGGGEVSLLEITSAYGVFANEGIKNPHLSLLKVETNTGEVLYEANYTPEKVIDKNIALQISDILKDNDARSPAFGEQSFLYFPERDVAAKTGTTNDYKDAWIIGYTPQIAVGAWAGNNDNTPMEKKVAGFIIAPLWNAFMKEAFAELPKESFDLPKEEDEKKLKPVLRGEWLGGESYFIDIVSGKRATEYTPEETKKESFVASVHSILYWLYKDDPRGEKPEYPNRDPQFALWETSVRKWVESQNIVEGSSIPLEEDPLHKPEFAPVLELNGLDETISYPEDQKIQIEIFGSSKFGLARVDLYINNIFIESSKRSPFVFSFVPSGSAHVEEENVIKIVGYDSIFNKTEIEKKFFVSF